MSATTLDRPTRDRRPSKLRPGGLSARALIVLLGLVWTLIAGAPLVFLVLTAFKGQFELLSEALWALPAEPSLDNFRRVIENDFFVFLKNSVVVVSISVTLILLVSSMAAFVFARIRFRSRTPLFSLVVAGLIVPIHVTLIPIYLFTRDIGLYDSIWGLVGPYVAFNVPVTVLILTGFMQAIPFELEEAARVDGAGPVRRFRSLIVPLSRPGLITVAIYNGVILWNEFVFAFVLTTTRANRTLPLAIWDFQGQYGSNVPVIMSVLTLSALPLVIAYLLGQERITHGIMAGALKG
ncbi:MAG TPA: carbohydrate ABC transporter permease [Egicoccus sp.]|nr:carbohydrate ABC transporter permease [Egicoccus sp.]HSK24117.1 carbohydrate ABC transporter permease [Egicoccus sp.]